MNGITSAIALALLSAFLARPAPAHNATDPASPRVTYFDSGQLELTTDGFAAELPAPPVGAVGYVVKASIDHDFTVTIENRNSEPAAYVELGGQFVLTVGGSYLVNCYGATPSHVAAFDGAYWEGPDCRTVDFSDAADEQFTPTYVAPIAWWDGRLTLMQHRDGVEGWMSERQVWHADDWSVPYTYSPVTARVRGCIVWLY